VLLPFGSTVSVGPADAKPVDEWVKTFTVPVWVATAMIGVVVDAGDMARAHAISVIAIVCSGVGVLTACAYSVEASTLMTCWLSGVNTTSLSAPDVVSV